MVPFDERWLEQRWRRLTASKAANAALDRQRSLPSQNWCGANLSDLVQVVISGDYTAANFKKGKDYNNGR
jgi:hypothetical protein